MRVVKKELKNASLVSEFVKRGELVCLPTDTLYGLVGNSLKREVVEKVYKVKGREPSKPLIVLFKSLEDALRYGVEIEEGLFKGLKELYPAPLTLIFPLKENSPFREVFGRDNLGIRIPKDDFLLKVIVLSFPLFAPSANPSGKKPAENCKECREYFEGKVPLCVEGKSGGKPSTVISLVNGVKVIREGAFPVEKLMEVLGE